MASATSLGIHRPVALDFLIREGYVSSTSSPEDYRLQTYCDDASGLGEEEVLVAGGCVTWSYGGVVQRVLKFDLEDQKITQVVLTWLQAGTEETHVVGRASDHRMNGDNGNRYHAREDTETLRGPGSAQKPIRKKNARSLVVLLNSRAHVHAIDGSSHVVNLPFEVERAFPTSRGLVIQRKIHEHEMTQRSPSVPAVPVNSFFSPHGQLNSPSPLNVNEGVQQSKGVASNTFSLSEFVVDSQPRSTDDLPRLFTLTDPLAPIGLVVEKRRATQLASTPIERLTESSGTEALSNDEELLYLSPSDELTTSSTSNNDRPLLLAMTINRAQQAYNLWYGAYLEARSVASWMKTVEEAQLRAGRNIFTNGIEKHRHDHGRHSGARDSFMRSFQEAAPLMPSKRDGGRLSGSFSVKGAQNGPKVGQGQILTSPEKANVANRRTSSILARSELTSQEQIGLSDWTKPPPAIGISNARRGASFARSMQGRKSFRLSQASTRASLPAHANALDDSFMQEDLHDLREDESSAHNDDEDFFGLDLEVPFEGVTGTLVISRVLTIPSWDRQDTACPAYAMPVPAIDSKAFTLVNTTPQLGETTEEKSVSLFIHNKRQGVLSEVVFRVPRKMLGAKNDVVNLPAPEEVLLRHHAGIADVIKVNDGILSRLILLGRNGLILVSKATGLPQTGHDLERHNILGTPIRLEETFRLQPANDLQLVVKPAKATGKDSTVRLDICTDVRGLTNAGKHGQIDLVDDEGVSHRISISFHPANAYVAKILDACSKILPTADVGDASLVAVYQQIVYILQQRELASEWTSLVIALFTLFADYVETPSSGKSEFHSKTESCWISDPAWRSIDVEGIDKIPQTFIRDCATMSRELLNDGIIAATAVRLRGASHDTPDRTNHLESESLARLLVELHLVRRGELMEAGSAENIAPLTKTLAPVLAQMGHYLGWEHWSWRGIWFTVIQGSQQLVFDTNLSSLRRGQGPSTDPGSESSKKIIGYRNNSTPPIAQANLEDLGTFEKKATTGVKGLNVEDICDDMDMPPDQEPLTGQGISELIYRQDTSFDEAQRLLRAHTNPIAIFVNNMDLPEAKFLEMERKQAQLVGVRSLAITTGAALLDLHGMTPLPTQEMEIELWETQVRMAPSGHFMVLARDSLTEQMSAWAAYHTGVAAGLRIKPGIASIDTSWIVLNKPTEPGSRHAGLLLGLGLNGYLRTMEKWLVFKYLTPKHDMTSISLLLGLGASYLGTMNSLVVRVLSIHLVSLLPVGAAELNLSPLVQTAGIMGVGLLYYNSQHRRMSEVMLSELEFIDKNDTEGTFVRDEGYRLAAGFALGFINLHHGADLKALHDMRIKERLLHLVTTSRDTSIVNVLDRATPGATIALALMFMKTHDVTLAKKIDVPSTRPQFDYVRPDVALLRVVARNLIMWNEIEPSEDWIFSRLPQDLRDDIRQASPSCSDQYCMAGFIESPLSSVNMHLYNIVAGLCWSVSLKYAGSGNQSARDCILRYYDLFATIQMLPALSFDHRLTLSTLSRLQHLLLLSAATVMAATGDLDVLRRARICHANVTPDSTFGTHQATHMALGALFLAQGRSTFSTTNIAIASLLCAFYPLFPKEVMDNKAHLQAFRHMWIFATEPRCLIPRDIETRRPVLTPIKVTLKDGSSRIVEAPALLMPSLDSIASVKTLSEEFAPVDLDFAKDPAQLIHFRKDQTLWVRRLSLLDQHSNDPYEMTLAQKRSEAAHPPRHGEGRTKLTSLVRDVFTQPLFSRIGLSTADLESIFPREPSSMDNNEENFRSRRPDKETEEWYERRKKGRDDRKKRKMQQVVQVPGVMNKYKPATHPNLKSDLMDPLYAGFLDSGNVEVAEDSDRGTEAGDDTPHKADRRGKRPSGQHSRTSVESLLFLSTTRVDDILTLWGSTKIARRRPELEALFAAEAHEDESENADTVRSWIGKEVCERLKAECMTHDTGLDVEALLEGVKIEAWDTGSGGEFERGDAVIEAFGEEDGGKNKGEERLALGEMDVDEDL